VNSTGFDQVYAITHAGAHAADGPVSIFNNELHGRRIACGQAKTSRGLSLFCTDATRQCSGLILQGQG
jgi:hypothetical protein